MHSVSLQELGIENSTVIILMKCGYTTVESLRNDLSWYDHPSLDVHELDAIRREIGVARHRIDSRFADQ